MMFLKDIPALVQLRREMLLVASRNPKEMHTFVGRGKLVLVGLILLLLIVMLVVMLMSCCVAWRLRRARAACAGACAACAGHCCNIVTNHM